MTDEEVLNANAKAMNNLVRSERMSAMPPDVIAVISAAQELVKYELSGTPEVWNAPAFWQDWDEHFAALREALEPFAPPAHERR